MKSLLLNALYALVRAYVNSGVFDRVAALVEELIDTDIPGSEKRDTVLQFVKDEFGEVWGLMTSIVVDLIIAVTRLKKEKPVEE
jgi:cytochrome b